MAAPAPPKRFALLVGIDLYLNDSSRKFENGNPVSLSNLQGCVNDVQAIKEFLRNEFQLSKPSVLTSSVTESIDKELAKPEESPDRWPTFANIKREFDAVYDHARAGDLFFFHFSGHGARLDPIDGSPTRSPKEPSLLTMDFCCGNPAVRGWQLNVWLKRLNEKKIQIIVILDSCHSGGSWRTGGRFRTPEGWITIPNLPVDKEVIKETTVRSNNRDVQLDKSWSINPEGFTLMAACGSNEKAAEITINGQAGGAFTHALLAYLKQNKPSAVTVTYRTLRDQIAQRVTEQTPKVYGRDRLIFFGNKEPFSATPLVVKIEDGIVFLPIGKIHGVQQGSEFTTYPPTSEIAFAIDYVDNFQCSSRVSFDCTETLRRHHCEVIPSRWSLGDGTFQVLVDPSPGNKFRGALYRCLKNLIVSNIDVIVLDGNHKPDSNLLRLENRGDDGIYILGPEVLIGHKGPVRGLDIKGANIEELAAKSAIALAHLARFGQILDLRNGPFQELAPFELKIGPENNAPSANPFPEGQKSRFVFENIGKSELHFTVMVLGPGFHIQQLYPSQETPETVPPGAMRSFTFCITIPYELKRTRTTEEGLTHRDIVRTVVTRGKGLSWKSLELPDIWNADQVERRCRNSSERDVKIVSDCTSDFGWWVEDREIFTSSA
ncbi:hypothetical protein FOPG_17207 [Fusarium oxysporum f. sp. conglutinans race 2 54008]|uniref:Peptidase C14 caspase domain-containing protein n=2 Tax=Fusarium oxysporum f. sp. conglutinans TaxID=100902 RepID=F9FEV8_FUSOF|nr:hypothetical protein FOXB_04936 [Fusarium oxysporum f. sp. conglutinans Fo5176]EXL66638.1 hypothetical protein FOPG_17207 [Fusarium oxysporum f. sp. conglutinans race 2 54008]KAG7001695.1 Metacaspase-1 [Fusarium oxysporum f. sp. conglutinans]